MKFKFYWQYALFFASIAYFLALVFSLPPHMDEFSQFHALACKFYDGAAFNNLFREGCSYYDLKLFGIDLPLRSYNYVGSIPGWIYFPFFVVARTYYSARILNFIYLFVFFLCLQKCTQLSKSLAALLVFFCFPLCYNFVIDIGPESFQLAALFLLPFVAARAKKKISGLGLGVIFFLCIWYKPFFLLFVPAMLLCFVALLLAGSSWREAIGSFARQLLVLWPGMLLAFFLSGILFLAKTRWGIFYLEDFTRWGGSLRFSEQVEHLKAWLPYCKSFANYADRIYGGTNNISPITVIYLFVGCATILWAVFSSGSMPAIFYGSLMAALLNFLLVNRVRFANAGHHFIFVFVFFLFALTLAIKKLELKSQKFALALCMLLAICGVYQLATLVQKRPLARSSFELKDLNTYLSQPTIAEKNVIVVLDWGLYYYQSLYGHKNQIVLYLQPLKALDKLAQVEAISLYTKRGILFASLYPSESDFNLIHSHFPTLHEINYFSDAKRMPKDWHLFGIQ